MNNPEYRAWDCNTKKMMKVFRIDWENGYHDEKNILRPGIYVKSYDETDSYWILHYLDYELMQFSGFCDKENKKIFSYDIIELINDINKRIIAICEYGVVRRVLNDVEVDIPSFYFRVPTYDDKKTFPIVNNYLGKHDLDLFKIIGNKFENPELLNAK